MSFSLIGHKIHNGIRNNRAEIASGLVMFPVYAGKMAVRMVDALRGVNTQQSGSGNFVPLLRTKNKCATSATVIKALENPTEKNVVRAFNSQMEKINNLNVNDSRKEKYEQRLSKIYSSYLNDLYLETKDIKSPIQFSILPKTQLVIASFGKDVSYKITKDMIMKIRAAESHFKETMPDNKFKIEFVY